MKNKIGFKLFLGFFIVCQKIRQNITVSSENRIIKIFKYISFLKGLKVGKNAACWHIDHKKRTFH